MSGVSNIREGDQVFGSDNQLLGTVEQLHGDGFHIRGQHIPGSAVARVAQRRVFLRGTAAQLLDKATTGGSGEVKSARGAESANEVRVPVAEERLSVEKRQAELGAVELRKTVTTEEQTIPVELMREEVRVERRDIADRPVSAADAEHLFEGGTIRVPVRGEEAVVTKEAVVTGEVVVNKTERTERQEVVETIRKEQVEVDENYREARPRFEEHFTGRQQATQAGRTFEQAEPNYRAGYLAGRDQRYAGSEFETVEPALRSEVGQSGGSDQWQELREEVREGWDRARSQR